ncbi:MAG: F0F1 ATP synthase subunit B [Bacteroidales bacterium]|jgi:F-type H+-transporting ATPase subunit b|nr:F0F1 ATP synthase subunit B [Bacteroidales bacterium]
MDLVTPGFGLLFWTTVSFLILVLLLAKFAWKPIMNGINARNKSIEDALLLAEKTKAEMLSLQADNERIVKEARAERDSLLKEAREMKDQLIAQAKQQAQAQADALIAQAKDAIVKEKQQALQELKTQVAEISIEIAEKVLSKELENKKVSEEIVTNSLNTMVLN